MKNPPIHAFADTEIMCRADVKYLRAGIGRALAQNCDAHIMSRFSDSTHFETMGLALCDTMSQAVLRHGLQACTDNRNHRDTEAFGETAVAVAVTSGMAKNMLLSGDFTTDKFGLANAMLTAVVSAGCNENRSDGEILALCALAALLYDGQVSEYMRLKRIFEKVNLPIILRDVGLSSQSADELAQMVCEAVKKGGYPCKATTETMAVTMKRAFRMLRTV
jgi:glycerol dehydrogenase-like iron-containing ADH family enzyme